MIFLDPYFWIRFPEKKLGANIAMMCHCMTQKALFSENPYILTIAIGVAVMTRFIIAYAIIPYAIASMSVGFLGVLLFWVLFSGGDLGGDVDVFAGLVSRSW